MPNLDPYTGNWTAYEARHLLKRTTFGPSYSMVETARAIGLQETISLLFEEQPLPDPPLRMQDDSIFEDPEVEVGETWVNADPFPDVSDARRAQTNNWRRLSLFAWTFQRYATPEISILEKMALFWHNHFVVSETFSPHLQYRYYSLLRTFATGNFRELAKEITVDPSMLFYLSGSSNNKFAPNDNYARELLELFTIGKGPQVAEGDYTNYTEHDVTEVSKILTGWIVEWEEGDNPLNQLYINDLHVEGNKTLSYRFNEATIEEAGEQEYRNLIDVIFQQDECSRFIMRKLYRWFVSDEITTDIEQNIIEPLAQILRENDYVVEYPLKVLFQSDHFYEIDRCMIKSPIDLIMSASKGLNIQFQDDLLQNYLTHWNYFRVAYELEHTVFQHQLVAGWNAYFQEPLYQKLWINNTLLPRRQEICNAIVTNTDIEIDNTNYTLRDEISFLEFVGTIESAEDPNILLTEISKHLFNYPITETQITSLKDVLIPGLPDFEWTLEYQRYLADPNDEEIRNTVETRLKNVFSILVRMSEFQIM